MATAFAVSNTQQTQIKESYSETFGPPPPLPQSIIDKIYVMRKAVEECSEAIRDNNLRITDQTIVIGILQAQIRIWVGVEEE